MSKWRLPTRFEIRILHAVLKDPDKYWYENFPFQKPFRLIPFFNPSLSFFTTQHDFTG